MFDRKELRAAGFTVTAEKTGASYPNYAPDIGIGWSYVLRKHGEKINGWRVHSDAWAWAQRLIEMTC